MATSLSRNRIFRVLQTYFHRLVPQPYRTPTILTSTAALLLLTPIAWKKFFHKPEILPPAPKDYKYHLARIANATSSTFNLPNGRKIGYATYGDPQGRPIIVLHGILGSRLENALFDSDAKDLGVRIIGIERPGIGWSSADLRPLSERTVLDHAMDVEALAEFLGLKEYGVIGMSGGGPYALGCASRASLSSSSASKPKLKAVSIVTGAGLSDMSQPWPAPLVWLNKNFDLRWLLKRVFLSGPEWKLMHLSDDERQEAIRQNFDLSKAHPADASVAKSENYPDMLRLFLLSSREAVSQGYNGFLDDAAILSKADPGFRVEEIPAYLPVQLWYGTDDRNISSKAGEETAERLRNVGNGKVELHMIEGETHGSTQVKYRRRALVDLVGAFGE